MTDDWDFYALQVDGEAASIFVDLGIQPNAPLRSHPHMAYVRLHMKNPRPDGLSSNEEFDTLIDIENSLETKLCNDGVGYVGRNTSGGCRDFYFYVSSANDWQGKVDMALEAFKSYRYEASVREDAGWTTYLSFLLPSRLDRQRIENRRVCEALERHGDKLTVEREIDHWIYFPSPEAVHAYLAEVVNAGFRVRNKPVSDSGTLRFGAQIWRTDIPSCGNIDDVTLPLLECAERHGGAYDGWECPVQG